MLSLIVPARNWPADRIEASVRSFLRLKSKTLTEVIVVDFGSEKPIKLDIRDRRVKVVRVIAERWSLAEAINVGVIAASNPILAKTDADIVVAREGGPGLDTAVLALSEATVGVAVVQAVDLQPGLDAATAYRASSASLAREGRLRPRWGQGGLCLFSAETWNEIGGFESRFHGWGNEDNDFADRVRRSGRRLQWIGPDHLRIFHVWHPPSYVATEVLPAREANRRVYLSDKSTFRSFRFRHSRLSSLPKPAIAGGSRPLVTVAFASKPRPNRERMLSEAIRGFVGQVDNDFEILIADNGSTGEESERLKKALARLPRGVSVRVIDLEQPSIPAARNRLTDEARGRYICVADDDDIPMPERLADHLAVFEKMPGAHGSHGGWIDFDEVTGVIDFNNGGERTLAALLYGPGKVSAHPATLMRADVMRRFRYDESCRVGSDFDLAARMANMGCRVEHTGSYVTLRRFHTANVTITDIADQRTVGFDARARIAETLGNSFAHQLKEIAKTAKYKLWCRNGMANDEIVGRLPGYVGVWRLLVPLSQLGRQPSGHTAAGLAAVGAEESDETPVAPLSLVNGHEMDMSFERMESAPAAASSSSDIVRLAQALDGLVEGDIGVVDCGLNPRMFFVSGRIKGTGRAFKLKKAIEEAVDINVELLPDVEYERRRSTRFDWSVLLKQQTAARLVSGPMELDAALAALTRLPGNTALRAMTTILADFNCTDQLFHLVTAPIAHAEGPARVRRVLERQTGESFRLLGPATVPRHGDQA